MADEQSSEKTLFLETLLKVQRKLEAVKKKSTNPHYKSKYANLEEVLSVCKEALNEAGLVLFQPSGKDANGHFVETLVFHSSGQSLTSRVYLAGADENMQKLGAAITYARRYGLVSLLALEAEDDDGESAVGRGHPTQTPAPAPAQVAANRPPKAQVVSEIQDLIKQLNEPNVTKLVLEELNQNPGVDKLVRIKERLAQRL